MFNTEQTLRVPRTYPLVLGSKKAIESIEGIERKQS